MLMALADLAKSLRVNVFSGTVLVNFVKLLLVLISLGDLGVILRHSRVGNINLKVVFLRYPLRLFVLV